MTPRIPIVDTLVPMTPAGAIADLNDVPPQLRTPSIRYPLTVPQLLERMDSFGIGQSIIPARRYGPQWGLPYEGVRDFVAGAPQRLFATAGIDPLDRMPGVRRFEEAIRDFGFVGAHTYASWSGVTPDDRLYYPYYAKAEELGVPFQVECMAAKQAMSMGHPRYLDRVASDFPDLRLIATHTGYPWERELVAYAEFRPNFYIGADTLPTELWGDELLRFIRGNSYAALHPQARERRAAGLGALYSDTSDRAVFGSNYISTDLTLTLTEIDGFEFSHEIWQKLMADNGRKLFGLPEWTG